MRVAHQATLVRGRTAAQHGVLSLFHADVAARLRPTRPQRGPSQVLNAVRRQLDVKVDRWDGVDACELLRELGIVHEGLKRAAQRWNATSRSSRRRWPKNVFKSTIEKVVRGSVSSGTGPGALAGEIVAALDGGTQRGAEINADGLDSDSSWRIADVSRVLPGDDVWEQLSVSTMREVLGIPADHSVLIHGTSLAFACDIVERGVELPGYGGDFGWAFYMSDDPTVALYFACETSFAFDDEDISRTTPAFVVISGQPEFVTTAGLNVLSLEGESWRNAIEHFQQPAARPLPAFESYDGACGSMTSNDDVGVEILRGGESVRQWAFFGTRADVLLREKQDQVAVAVVALRGLTSENTASLCEA